MVILGGYQVCGIVNAGVYMVFTSGLLSNL